jgi:hypothetical protein
MASCYDMSVKKLLLPLALILRSLSGDNWQAYEVWGWSKGTTEQSGEGPACRTAASCTRYKPHGQQVALVEIWTWRTYNATTEGVRELRTVHYHGTRPTRCSQLSSQDYCDRFQCP